MKDCQLEEKFCYLKVKLTYPNKNKLHLPFLKKEQISFVLLQK